MHRLFLKLRDVLERGKRFLITTHVHPDADAIASELLVRKLLKKRLGKDVVVINDAEVPGYLKFLPGIEDVRRWGEVSRKFDVAVVLDVGRVERMGRVREAVEKAECVVNVDHHRSNGGFGDVVIIDTDASSTGELLYRFMKDVGFEIDRLDATYVLVAVLTDTGRFSYDNTKPQTLRIAAELLEYGVNLRDVMNGLYRSCSREQMALQARALASLKTNRDGTVAWVVLRWRDFEETGAHPDDTQEFPEIPRSLRGVKIGFYVRELQDGRVKVSLRSNCGLDLNRFAVAYGGGGHKAAAGITFSGMSLEETERFVVGEIEEWLRRGGYVKPVSYTHLTLPTKA